MNQLDSSAEVQNGPETQLRSDQSHSTSRRLKSGVLVARILAPTLKT